MDGINPTLAFGVLLFGLSGNARDAANDPATTVDVERGSGCPTLMVAPDPSQTAAMEPWAAYWNSAASASALPDVMDPKWIDFAFPEIESLDPSGSDSIKRQVIPVANVLAMGPESDPCGPER